MSLPLVLTVFHGVLVVALVGALATTALELSRVSRVGSTARAIGAGRLALLSALLVNLTGGYIYTFYRLRTPASPRSVILQTAPWVHQVLFENMEYMALGVPLMIAVPVAAMVVYGPRLRTEAQLHPWIDRLLYAALFVVLLMAIAGFIPSLVAVVR